MCFSFRWNPAKNRNKFEIEINPTVTQSSPAQARHWHRNSLLTTRWITCKLCVCSVHRVQAAYAQCTASETNAMHFELDHSPLELTRLHLMLGQLKL